MANVKITDLPLLNFSAITNNDVLPIVDVNSVVTSKVTVGDLKNYFDSTFNGGTVTGATEFTNGLSANTISASTYLGLPTDVFVTGGTFSGGDIIFTNNTGGTFNVSGISSFDTFVTGFTYNDNTFTIGQNSGSTLSATINSVTGLTSSGTIQSNVVSATTYLNLPSDIYVTGYSYFNNTFTIERSAGQPNLFATINSVTGLTSIGIIESNIISATTISGGTFFGDGSNLSGLITGYSYSQVNNYVANIPTTITHNFNTTDVVVQIIDTNTNELIFGSVTNYQSNSVDVTLNNSLNGIKVIIVGASSVTLTPSGLTTVLFGHDSVSPADSTTYYIGGQFNLGPITSPNDGRRLISQITGLITQVSISRIIGGTLGTNELNTFTINNVTQSTSSTITTTETFDSSSSLNNYVLASPLSVVNGDKIQIEWTTPIFATNPTTVRQQINVLIKY